MDFTPEEARQFTDEFRLDIDNSLERWEQKAKISYERNAWGVLGFKTWHEYSNAELSGFRPAIERSERKELVAEFKDIGMNNVEIASTLGIGEATVRRDMKSSTIETFVSPNDEINSSSSSISTDSDIFDDLDDIESYQIVESTSFVESKVQETIADPEPPKDTWSKEERELQVLVLQGETVVASLRSGVHRNLLSWAESENVYVRIDRKTQWGNPFELPADGDRETVIKNYENYYLPHKPSILSKLDTLKGKVLVCWCAPLPCHGHVLKRLAEQ